MFNKFKKSELFILIVVICLIFSSEYFYLVEKNFQKAIFIGLWPPTIVALLIFFNLKLKKQMKNLDIFIFTGLVLICFISFFVSTFRAFENNAINNNYLSKKSGIISRFLAYLESLVSEQYHAYFIFDYCELDKFIMKGSSLNSQIESISPIVLFQFSQ